MKKIVLSLSLFILTPAISFCAVPRVDELAKHPFIEKGVSSEKRQEMLAKLYELEKKYLALKDELRPVKITKQEQIIENALREILNLIWKVSTDQIKESKAKSEVQKLAQKIDQALTHIEEKTNKQRSDLGLLVSYPFTMIICDMGLKGSKFALGTLMASFAWIM